MRKRGFILAEAAALATILLLVVSIILLSFSQIALHSRDAKRKSDLQNIDKALKTAASATTSSTTPFYAGVAFSVWSDGRCYQNTPYWEQGNHPYPVSQGAQCAGSVDPSFHDLVVGKVLSTLPVDPHNADTHEANFLGDGSAADQGYLYWSKTGQSYLLGTNLESDTSPAKDNCGNYQIKSDASVLCLQ
jgi:hypothetical protein